MPALIRDYIGELVQTYVHACGMAMTTAATTIYTWLVHAVMVSTMLRGRNLSIATKRGRTVVSS